MEEKKKTGKAVTDKSREGEILFRLLSSALEEFSVYIKELYETVFVLSRAYQSTLIGKESKTVNEIRALIEKGLYSMPTSATIACQGVAGAFGMTAAQKFYEKYGFCRVYEKVAKTEHFACDVRYIKDL